MPTFFKVEGKYINTKYIVYVSVLRDRIIRITMRNREVFTITALTDDAFKRLTETLELAMGKIQNF